MVVGAREEKRRRERTPDNVGDANPRTGFPWPPARRNPNSELLKAISAVFLDQDPEDFAVGGWGSNAEKR